MEFNLIDIVQHVLNIFVLYLLLRMLLYKPVRAYMLAREAAQQKLRDETAAALQDAQKLKERREKEMLELQALAHKQTEEKLAHANHTAEQLITQAQTQAQAMLHEARAQIRREEQEVRNELTDQTAALAMDLAIGILGREISKEDNQRLIDDYFRKVG